jgi:VWFA-related protein
MVDGLYSGLKLLEDTEGRPLLIVFTDGLDNVSWFGDEEVLELVRESEAMVYVVSLRPARSSGPTSSGFIMSPQGKLTMAPHRLAREEQDPTRFPRRVAELSGGRFIYADSSERLEEAFLTIHSEMRTRYLLSYSPREASQAGWHRLEVKIKRRNLDVRARLGYYLPPDG